MVYLFSLFDWHRLDVNSRSTQTFPYSQSNEKSRKKKEKQTNENHLSPSWPRLNNTEWQRMLWNRSPICIFVFDIFCWLFILDWKLKWDSETIQKWMERNGRSELVSGKISNDLDQRLFRVFILTLERLNLSKNFKNNSEKCTEIKIKITWMIHVIDFIHMNQPNQIDR